MPINLHAIINGSSLQLPQGTLPRCSVRTSISASYLEVLNQLLTLDIRHHQAPLLALNHEISSDHQWWLRADPVEIQAENNSVYMLGNEHLAISNDEATSLSEVINQFLVSDQLSIITASPTAWYFTFPKDPQIETISLRDVLYKNLYNYLPRGQRQNYWCQLLTELQMLLHNSDVNKQRIKEGRPQINSLWFWGEGQLPLTMPQPCWQRITSNDPLLAGYAKWQGIDYAPMCDRLTLPKISDLNGEQLLAFNVEPMASEDTMQQFHQTLLKHLLLATKSNHIQHLTLYYPGEAKITITPKDLKSWWQRLLMR